MTAYVVDASVVVKWFFPEEYSVKCRELLSSGNDLSAPSLIWSEAGNVIWKRFRRGEISPAEARETVVDILQMPVLDISSKDLLPSALEIAVAVGISVYDALYLSLALSRTCLMITADKKLINILAGTMFEANVHHISTLG
jgi:predicted nucleic acid-binding protein